MYICWSTIGGSNKSKTSELVERGGGGYILKRVPSIPETFKHKIIKMEDLKTKSNFFFFFNHY